MTDAQLSDRKAAILRAVVEGYTSTARPVGSGAIVDAEGLEVSSATVRKELLALEQAGFLEQPHTSAGRVPTDKGYRYFVDELMRPFEFGQATNERISHFFERAHGEIETMLRDTSRLLSQLTHYTSVVVGPGAELATVRSVQLVGLHHDVALVVVVMSNGAIEKYTVDLPGAGDGAARDAVDRAGAVLAGAMIGRPLADAAEPAPTGDVAIDDIVSSCVDAIAEGAAAPHEQFYVGGTPTVASLFAATEQVREVLSILEKQYVMVTLVRDVIDRGLTVAIGSETGVEPLAECSVVVAPYLVEGSPAGQIAVLGPTHMNYPQAVAAVAVVSAQLGSRLSEG
ncbi:MAG: heat-inducible transcriptional repressor HrcA [Acidimicrobiales bacterium]